MTSHLDKVLGELRRLRAIDMSGYRRDMLERRLAVRMEQLRCDDPAWVAEVVSLTGNQAAAKQLKLKTILDQPLPETVLTDPLRLRQVLVNLVGNAIKFTEQGEVCLAVRLKSDRGPPRLCFDVTDTGIGMSEEQIGRLFQPFTQVDNSSTRKFGGSGLGLCISKRLTEALGGNIEVRSEPGKGSTFNVTIDPGPLDGMQWIQNTRESLLDRPPTTTAATSEKSALCGRILLAEDGPDNQRLISLLLRKAGADVVAVENGQLAVEQASIAWGQGRPFDVILLDMQMPVMDGYAATRQLREQGYTGPIVALTAHAMAEDRQKCLDAGCDDYTTKPIDRQRLIDMIVGFTGEHGDTSKTPQQPQLIYSTLAAEADLDELVDMFVQEMPERINVLQAVANARNWEQLARRAHQLKGAAGSYGFHEITPCAARLESAARDSQQEDRLLAAIDELLDLCRRARSGTPPADQDAPNAPPQIV